MAAPYKSAQKLRRDNALSEITSNATLKARALANLGIAGEGAQLDSVWAVVDEADGTKKAIFDVGGNTTAKTLTLASAVTLDRTVTFPNASVTLASVTGTEELTNKTLTAQVIKTGLTASGSASNDFSASTGTFKSSTGLVTLAPTVITAGTASVAPLCLTAGTNLTTPVAGAIEFDGVVTTVVNDTTSGRAYVPAEQYFRLTANGSTISTIGNYFGATSNIPLVANAFYEIDIYSWFLNSTSGTVVWTLTNSAAPTAQNIYYEMSPATGVVAPPGTATMLIGQVVNDATATLALTATAALTDAVNHYMHMRIFLKNGTGTSLKIQATKSAGSITPLVGSYYRSRRLPASSTGAVAA